MLTSARIEFASMSSPPPPNKDGANRMGCNTWPCVRWRGGEGGRQGCYDPSTWFYHWQDMTLSCYFSLLYRLSFDPVTIGSGGQHVPEGSTAAHESHPGQNASLPWPSHRHSITDIFFRGKTQITIPDIPFSTLSNRLTTGQTFYQLLRHDEMDNYIYIEIAQLLLRYNNNHKPPLINLTFLHIFYMTNF